MVTEVVSTVKLTIICDFFASIGGSFKGKRCKVLIISKI